MTAVALNLCISMLMLWLVAAVQADVAHLGYSRYRGERLHLQRLESEPTPYPAAGYRPDREFSLPQNRPLFPQATQHSSRPFGSSGFNHLGEAQRPQLTYGSPQPEPRFRSQNRPQTFNYVDEPQEQQIFVVKYHQRPESTAETGFNNFERPENNDFNNFADDQPYDLEEDATISDQNQPPNGFNNLAESQQPDSLYGAPHDQQEDNVQSSRLRQQLVARLQRAERLEQRQQLNQAGRQRFVNAPQTLYTAPHQAESQISRLTAQKPARLTDNREDTEIETDIRTAETEEIETTTKAEDKKTNTQTAAAGSVPPAVANMGVVGYYPASAVGFVQPLNGAAYLAAANYQTVQPFSAAYTVGAPYLPQQYVLAAAPSAPLKAW